MRWTTHFTLYVFLVVICLVGGQTEETSSGSFSSGSTSVSGGAVTFSSASGTGSGTSTVTTRTSVSTGGKTKTTTSTTTGGQTKTTTSTTGTGSSSSKKKGRGKGKTKWRSEEVEVGKDTVKSASSASGTGSVHASASATVGPSHSKGTASTTVGGKKRTVTKETGGDGIKVERTSSTTASGSKREKGRAFKTPSKYKHYPVCRGLAKFKCCDDRKFHKIDDEVYCGCWGDEPTKDYCSYLRLNSEPLIVKDIFGAISGDICICEEDRAVTNEILDGCRGTIKRDCCDLYKGEKSCRCQDATCQYARVSNKPLMWKSRSSDRVCVC